MKLTCLATGSSGNCYTLTSAAGETLILDCGVPIKDIKRGLDWNIKCVAGCIVTHEHKDHSLSFYSIRRMGIKVFTPYEDLDRIEADENVMLTEKIGGFTIKAFQVPHNGTRNCGFLIYADGQKILYLTDLEYCPYSFKNTKVNQMLIECNYIKDMINTDLPNYIHKVRGHCELETTKGIVATNNSEALQNVILCHMGVETCDNDRIIAEVQKIAPQANIDVAEAGKSWILRKGDECPF